MSDGKRSVEQEIASWLEYFLCDAFDCDPESARRGWWSDGVMDLRIEQLDNTSFRAIGSTYFGERNVREQWVGPFEVEFYFAARGSLEFVRTIVRFGWKDKKGRIVRSGCLHPRLRSTRRGLRNADWALAIELTPPKKA